jgi:hypothetical protein
MTRYTTRLIREFHPLGQGSEPYDVEISSDDGDLDLDKMLQMYERFLLACGYQLGNTHLELVDDE